MVWANFFHVFPFDREGGSLKLFGQCPYITNAFQKRGFPYLRCIDIKSTYKKFTPGGKSGARVKELTSSWLPLLVGRHLQEALVWSLHHGTGWQKLCEGTKGLCQNLVSDKNFEHLHTLFCRDIKICRKIYALFGNLLAKKGFLCQKQCCLGKKVHLCIGCIIYYTELDLQICKYALKTTHLSRK